jgi:hypothetical protein
MRNVSSMVRGMVAASALMLVAAPAFAGDEERARAAIAEAQGKIDAAGRVKAGDVTPDQIASAQASLKLAQEELKSGHEQKAIQAAIQAQQFADTAIGRVAQRQDATVNAQSAVAADAQADAAAANARADAAEQAAASAAADARAARSAPPVVIAPRPTTTVTTETVRSTTPARATPTATRRPVKKTVKRTTAATRPVTTKTTTTVTTN